MKTLFLVSAIALVSSCSSMGLKRVDGAAAQPAATAKKGVTWGGPVASGGGVDTGYWCEVRGGILTFGEAGPSEAIATENAQKKCKDMFKDSPCKLISCKRN